MTQRPRFFYGWYLVAVTIVAMTLVYGIRASFSVFFSPVLDEFHWYRGSTAIMLSLNILVYGLTAPLVGSLVDRWKPRTVVVFGILMLTLATASCYFASQLWHFYLLFGVLVPIGAAFCGAPVLNPTLINWFGKKSSLAIAFGQIGGSLSFAYVTVIEVVVASWGWRASFLVMGGLVLAVLLPLYLIFLHHRPSDRGLETYGEAVKAAAVPGKDPGTTMKTVIAAERDWTLRGALRTHNLWLLILADFCYWGIGNYLVLAHQIRFAQDAGYSGLLAASIFGLFGIISIGGQLIASVSDMIGRETTVLIAVVLAIGALVALISVRDTSQPWLLYVYATAFGLGTGLFSPTIVVGTADIFRGRNIGAIAAVLLTGVGFGGAIGPWLGGYIYDVTGSYKVAFIISMAAFAVAGISFWIAAPRNAEKMRARLQITR
jgi:MFS family permease